LSRPAPRPLATALRELTGTLAPASTLARVQEAWKRAAGEHLAARASPTGERDGVLTLTCADAAWAQELHLMAGELIPRLNDALGAERIRELRCRTL
jgi:predicted nucleic acid-binding Zn ribbon protein